MNNYEQNRPAHAVWVLLKVAPSSEKKIRRFFEKDVGIPSELIRSNLHLTVYHARRHLEGLYDYDERISILVEAEHLRFMVLAPGGENPRPGIDPTRRSLGLRIRRSAAAMSEIEQYRARFYNYELKSIIGSRKPSDQRRSAFGSHHFQPHIAILNAGCPIDPDLTKLGDHLRNSLDDISFNRLTVRCFNNTGRV